MRHAHRTLFASVAASAALAIPVHAWPAPTPPSQSAVSESVRTDAFLPRTAWRAPAGLRVADAHTPAVLYVKFVDDLPVESRGDRIVRTDGALADADALAALPIASWRPVHAVAPERLDAMRVRAQATLRRGIADMTTEFFAFVDDARSTQDTLDALNALDAVEVALPLPKPPAPPLPPDFEPEQGYLAASPTGVDAQHAWADLGTRGAGVSIADLEYVYETTHADLPVITLIGGAPVDPGFGPDHGTAVLGELAALNNGWGATGIASDADIHFASTFAGGVWNVAGAITASVNALEPGDIILLEQQMGGPNGQYVPVEWFPPWYNAVVAAVGNGYIVVMAAGNGGQNLDDPMFSQGNGGHWPFLPVNDSGAIIVGAGAAPTEFGGTDTPRSRLGFSTYGSRVNVQAWGQRVWTTGYGSAYDQEGIAYEYTSSFGGTSSASPMVAATCAIIQAVHKARFQGATLTSREMRDLLIATGAAQQSGINPLSQHIGPMPDIAAAVAELEAPLPPCTGDANGDRVVNFADLTIVLSDYGRTGRNLRGDLDHDEDVDFVDLNAVLSRFGQSCP